jgi:glycosyltransferase involved in cell wall biosynthesis
VVAPDGLCQVYAAGLVPRGQFVEELGALHGEPGARRSPVWVTTGGRVLTEDEPLTTEAASLAWRMRWVLSPLRWSRGPVRALRLVAWRLRHARQFPLLPSAASAAMASPPDGYLERHPGPDLLPLFEAIHPITGDQLVTTNHWEVTDLGYVHRRLLGYVHVSAPVTGGLDAPRPELAWASRAGRRPRSDVAWQPACPGAQVDRPQDGWIVSLLPATVAGWAMFPRESVVRIDMTVNGNPAGRARLGLPRLDVAARCDCVDAPVSGWEHALDARVLPPRAHEAILGGTVHGSAGGKIALPEVRVGIAESAWNADDRPLARLVQRRSATTPLARRDGDPLRILAVTHCLTYGGAQLYLAELVERLGGGQRASFTVASPTDGPLRERLEQAGASVHLSPAPLVWTAEAYDARIAEIVAWAAPQRFDLVVVNTITSFYGVEVANRLGIPSIFAIHESLDPREYWAEHLEPQDRRVRDRLQEAVALTSAAVFEAEATRQLFLPYGDRARCLAMPYGIDLAAVDRFRSEVDRETARASVGLPVDAVVVLCLGTIEPRKAQASLARAFGRIAERHPNAILALVGQVDARWREPYRVALSEHLLRAGTLDRVVVAPLGPDPFPWHAAADVLVCASDNESLPRVILEAMAFETPVVSTAIFGIPEVIEDGVTGYLCRERDEEDLAGTLDSVLGDDHDHRPVIAAAAEAVRRRHDADDYAAGFERLARALVEDPCATPVSPLWPRRELPTSDVAT